jgi:threonine synthase
VKLVCVACNKVQERGYKPVCDACGALTNPEYDLSRVRFRRSANPYVRFSGLLPVKDKSLLPDSAAYTPVVHARNLGRKIGLPGLFLKNETILPTGTTKFRMAAVALPYLYECGVKHFCTSSTGNTSTAYAARIPDTPDIRMTLFTASGFRHRVNYVENPRIRHYVLEDANFAEAFECAGVYARENGYTSERGFFNPGRREGLKLAFFEATEQVPGNIDCYVQGVSSAMGVYGTYSGARELYATGQISRIPRLLCVQQSSCAPMATAWSEGADHIDDRHIVRNPTGIAEAILRGDPTRVYPYVKAIVEKSGGQIVSVTEEQIRAARQELADEEGVDACFSASTALAGLIEANQKGLIPAEETILVNLTGRDRVSEPIADYFNCRTRNGVWEHDGRRLIQSAGSP